MNLVIKMQENTCLYSYSSLYLYSFLRKPSPYTLIQACTRIRDCRVHKITSIFTKAAKYVTAVKVWYLTCMKSVLFCQTYQS